MSDLVGISSMPPVDVSDALVPSALRPGAPQAPQGKEELKKAARQFEAYFVGYLMGVMRETVPDGPFDSKAAKAFYSFYDAEIGRLAAESGGIGLATSLEESLQLRAQGDAKEELKSSGGTTDTTGR